MTERWKPGLGDAYYYIDSAFNVDIERYDGHSWDDERIAVGNCFNTKDGACATAEKVKALLLSLHDNDENLQDMVTNTCKALDKGKENVAKATCSFGNLSKLTAEVFNRPDCPDEATFAIVYQNGSAAFFRGNCYDIKPSERGWGYSCSSGVYQLCEIPGNWDASDWQHSLVRRPKPTTDGKLHIRFKKLHKDAKAPYQGTPGSAGYDLTAVSVEPIKDHIFLARYGTGLAVEIPKGYVGLVFPRSSVYKTDQFLTNSVGVIDSDYRGEITAVFSKGNKENAYKVGDRIMQLVIMPVPAVEFVEAEELTQTERGAGGYGSTGR